MNKLKLITVVGTRPEIIRLSRTMSLLDEHLIQIIVHTGQNYDYELNEIFWSDLELRKPDYFLGINTSSVGKSVADIISKTEEGDLVFDPFGGSGTTYAVAELVCAVSLFTFVYSYDL